MGQVRLRTGLRRWKVETLEGEPLAEFTDWAEADRFARGEAENLRVTLTLWTNLATYTWED